MGRGGLGLGKEAGWLVVLLVAVGKRASGRDGGWSGIAGSRVKKYIV